MYDEPACLLPVDCLGLGLNGERHLLGWQPALRGPVRRQQWRVQTRQQHAAARLAPSLTAAAIAVSAAAVAAAIVAADKLSRPPVRSLLTRRPEGLERRLRCRLPGRRLGHRAQVDEARMAE
eukprot:scaffold67494_cov43-Phaeocystis_antarctica.AAC.1